MKTSYMSLQNEDATLPEVTDGDGNKIRVGNRVSIHGSEDDLIFGTVYETFRDSEDTEYVSVELENSFIASNCFEVKGDSVKLVR